MPNHMHAIIVINSERNGVKRWGVLPYAPTRLFVETPFRSPSRTVGAIIRGFKAASTKQINALRGTPGARVWQRNYYEHIIRDQRDFGRIVDYIRNNPLCWQEKHEQLDGSAK